MAIQHRRGADVDFKAEKMLPGEIAVTIDGTRKVYAAFAPGDVKELASKEEVQKIVDNFENSVDEKINEAVQQVTDEATEQVEGIVAKGEEILNSIPADYQETVKEVAQLKEDLTSTIQSKADAIICEAEGTTIVATDSSDAGFEGLSLYGKSEQGSTTGAQLLDYSVWKTVAIINGTGVFENNGITITATKNDAITDYTAEKCRILVSEGETITLSWESDDDINGQVYIFPNGKVIDFVIANNKYEKSVSYTVPSGITFITFRFGVSEAGNTIHYKNIMINKGTKPLPWEPYTGNKPSPNPEYPQDVVSVGDGGSVEGKVFGNNLFDASFRWYNNSNAILANGGSVIEEKGVYKFTTSKEDAHIWMHCNTSKAYETTYGPLMFIPDNVTQISVSLSNKDFKKNMLCFYDENLICIGMRGTDNASNGYEWTFTVPNGAKYCTLRFGLYPATVGQTYETTVMVNYGTPLPYEPYTEQPLAIQTPNGLPGIPLGTTIPDVIKNSPIHMSGVYWDNAEGQYYIADTVDGENGVRVQRIKEWTLDGAINANLSSSYGSVLRFDTNITSIAKMDVGLCDSLSVGTIGTADLECFNVHGSTGRILIQISSSRLATPDESGLIAYLKTNPMKFILPLATPIETPLTDEEIAAYKSLHTNKPTTTIMNSENVFMKAKYVADTKNHIKQNYIPLSKYTALEERVAAIEELVIS